MLAAGEVGHPPEGKMLSVDATAVALTYDALGRMVEQNRSGVYKQVVYSPSGGKLALMSGQTLSKAFIPLPGGATAVYTSSGLAYYRHSDWLGSSRLATTPTRTKYYDGAYAPFGENYAGSGTTDLDFTGQNQDTVANYYDFLFREYSMVQGRWMSPDPAGMAAVSPANPQSWNRYAYVANRPTSLVDPLGLFIYSGPCGYLPDGTPQWVCDEGPGNTGADGMGWMFFGNDGICWGCGPIGIGGKSGGGGGAVKQALKTLQSLLPLDPRCLQFLGGSALSNLSDIIDNNLYGVTTIEPTLNGDGSITMNNGDLGLIPGQVITVNTLGAFFNSTYNGFDLTTDRGRIKGGSPQAQVFIVLHELAHSVGAILDDANQQKLIDKNDKNIEKECKQTIKQAGK